MKNAEMNKVLVKAMEDFRDAYDRLRITIDRYEQTTGASVNDLPGFTESYPFGDSFDELAIDLWVDHTVDKIRQSDYTILNYEYLNTGGNCMVGISEVWLPEKMQTVYVYVNEEGYTMSAVDYIRNELEIDDYDALTIEADDWGRTTGHETYFNLYRHCLNEYIKDDCRYFKYTTQLPLHLLSDELQKQITADYALWLEANEYDTVETDGVKIVISPYYEIASDDEKLLNTVRAFQQWHDSIACCEEYYEKMYKLTFADKSIELPFVADVWDAVDNMLISIIKNY